MRHRIRIERPVKDTATDSAGSSAWQFVAEAAAEVQDMLPSRGEQIAGGINVASRPARVRMRFRTDLTAAMRVLVGRNLKDADGVARWHTDRTAQIVTVPAELGNREALEFLIQDSTSPGNAS